MDVALPDAPCTSLLSPTPALLVFPPTQGRPYPELDLAAYGRSASYTLRPVAATRRQPGPALCTDPHGANTSPMRPAAEQID
jgi:hypothetical protein